TVQPQVDAYASKVDMEYLVHQRARALYQLGQVDEARESLINLVVEVGDESHLDAAQARLLLASIYREQGDTDAALAEAQTAAAAIDGMSAFRQAASAWRELGDLYRDLGRIDEALDAFDRALESARVMRSPVPEFVSEGVSAELAETSESAAG